MLIKRVIAIQVPVKRAVLFRNSGGVRGDAVYGIVIVEADTGLRGVGEISMSWNGGGSLLCPMVEQILGPAVVGGSVFDVARAVFRMDEAVKFSPAANPAKAAIDIALHDLAGRALGVPVYVLLGGRMREEIVASMAVSIAPIDDMLAEARSFIERGFRGIKIKVGGEAEHDVATVSAIRQELGTGVVIRLDANSGWKSVTEAMRILKRFEPANIHSIEQPLPRGRIEDLARLRAVSPIPIMVDESVWGVDDAYRVLHAGAADIINVYISEAGGLHNAMRIIDMAESAGVTCTIGSMREMGIGTAAAAHAGIAARTLCEPADVCGLLYNVDSLIKEQWEPQNGVVKVPDSPGLGVNLDETRLVELNPKARELLQ